MQNIVQKILFMNVYIQPVIFFMTLITNILNILILRGRTLHRSPCTHYFLAHAVVSIVYSCLLCPTLIGRAISRNWAEGDIGCKVHAYVLFVLPLQANFMIILASFDRFCSSSSSKRLHSISTVRNTRMSILCSFIFCILYMAPMLFIYYWDKSTKKCSTHSTAIIHIYVLSQGILYYILSSILILFFGILTINNIRKNKTRTPTKSQSRRRRRTEGQLARMLLFQVTVHLVLVLPFGLMYLINSFFPSTQTQLAVALRFIFVIIQQCDCFASFFLYTLTGSVYRQELMQMFNIPEYTDRTVLTLREPRVFLYAEFPVRYSSLYISEGNDASTIRRERPMK